MNTQFSLSVNYPSEFNCNTLKDLFKYECKFHALNAHN